MSKLFISAIKHDIDEIQECNSSYFKTSFKYESENINIVAFEKANVCFDNYYVNLDDFGVIVGTYIYKDKTGKEAIKNILESFSPNMISVYKKDIVGMWAACIHKDGYTYLFNDYFGLYDVCYTNNEKFRIGTALGDVADISDVNELDEYSFVMESFQSGAFPGKSIFKNINKLVANKYLCIANKKLTVNDIQNKKNFHYEYTNEENAIKDIANLLVKYAEKVNKVFGNQSCFMTGGLDSRLVFGAFNRVGSNFECVYGQGVGSQKGDLILVEQLSNFYKKKLNILNWNYSEEDNHQKQKDVYRMIDFNNWIANGYKPHIESFASCSKERPFYAFGYFCEAIRLRDWAESKGKTFSLFDFIDNYYINRQLAVIYDKYEEYRGYLVNEYKTLLSYIGVDSDYEHISIDKFERFRWIMARFCDSRAEFMLNNFGYAFSIMSIPQIHETILSIPADVIKGGAFQAKVINELDSRLVRNFDVFSHLRPYRINKKFNKVRKLSMKMIADNLFIFIPFIKPFIIKLYRNIRYGNAVILKKDVQFLEPLEYLIPHYIKYKEYDGSLSRLKSIIVGLNDIRNQ